MAESDLRLAASPTSWGVDFADDPENPPWPRVLDEIARSGLGRLELGPVGYLPEEPAELLPELSRRGLAPIGSFVFEPLHDPEALPEVLERTRRACRTIRAAGGELLVVIDLVSDARARTAGRPDAAPRLEGGAWEELRDAVRRVAEIAHAHELRPVLHNHVGSYVEFEAELEALLDAIPADELGACLDTGHAAYAGFDPAAAVAQLGPRLEHVHLKDVDPARHASAVGAGASFWTAVAGGVFCPIGDGKVDFAALGAALAAGGYGGPATLEQDGDRRNTSRALGDLRRSVEALARAGFPGVGGGAAETTTTRRNR